MLFWALLASGQILMRKVDALYLMLKNRIYRGEIVHKGKAFPGEHAAIVDEDLWRRVLVRATFRLI